MMKKLFKRFIVILFIIIMIFTACQKQNKNESSEKNDKRGENMFVDEIKEKITINTQSSIMLKEKGLTFYFDPIEIKKKRNDADFIFITHDHFDHMDAESIKNLMNEDTYFVCPETISDNLSIIIGNTDKVYALKEGKKVVHMNKNNEFDFECTCIPAYNIGKDFHKKEYGYLSYILNVNNTKYYIAGDTDVTEESKKVECDVAFVPVGGKYTMDYNEAADLINIIKPKVVIPVHYGSIVGGKDAGDKFKELVDKDVEVLICL